jgi:hypothetical protein
VRAPYAIITDTTRTLTRLVAIEFDTTAATAALAYGTQRIEPIRAGTAAPALLYGLIREYRASMHSFEQADS